MASWRILLWAVSSALLVVGQFYLTIPLIDDIAHRFEVAPERAALAGSGFGLAYATGLLLLGPLSDRYGPRLVLAAGLVALAVTTAAASQAATFNHLLAARVAQGFSAAAFPPAALALLAAVLPAERQPLGISLISFAFLASAPTAQFAVSGLGVDLPTAMLSLSPLYVLSAAALLALAPPARSIALRASARQRRSAALLLRDPMMLAAWAVAATVLFGFIAFQAGAQALTPEIGADLQLLRLAGLPPLLMTLVAARLIRRLGAPGTAVAGLALGAAALGLAQTAAPASLILGSALLSAGTALAVPSLIAAVSSRAGESSRGLALAVYSFILFLGASAAPPIGQALAMAAQPTLWLLAPALVLACAAVVMLGAIRWQQPPLHPRPTPARQPVPPARFPR